MEQLKLNINSLSEMFNEGDGPLDINSYKLLTNDINSLVTLLTDLKSTLENNQYDFDSYGGNTIEVDINYDYNLSRVTDNYVIYNYSHNSDSGSVHISKDVLIEHIDNNGDIDELITDEIDSTISNQLS